MLFIPLGSCDMVFGIQWLSTLGTVMWDFNQLHMEFSYKGRPHILWGIQPKRLAMPGKDKLTKEMEGSAQICLLQVLPLDCTNHHYFSCWATEVQVLDPSLSDVLQQYEDVFAEPQGLLPLRRLFDYSIPLQLGSQPINIRPYWYPMKQKDVLEQLVQKLDQGVIQHSFSPFASPVVLVRKKDGTWHLCVDYQELNKQTLKISFPFQWWMS